VQNDPMPEVLINNRWSLRLPSHRAARGHIWETWEAVRLDALHKAVRPGDVIYDIGTEEGDLSGILAQWTGSTGRLHLFEPNHRVWPNIRAIWEANNLPALGGYFVGFAAHESEYSGSPWPIAASHWPECAYGDLIGDHGFCNLSERPDIARTRIDDYRGCVGGGPVDVITIDVEGSELQVLRGAETTLRETHPVVFVSIHPEMMFHHHEHYENELHWFMEHDLGYKKHFLAHDHETHYVYQHPENLRLAVTEPVVSCFQRDRKSPPPPPPAVQMIPHLITESTS